MLNRFNAARRSYGKKPEAEHKGGSEVRKFLSVATFVLVFIGLYIAVSTFFPTQAADVTDEAYAARMTRAQEITTAYGQLAPWLTDCTQKSVNPATCYFGTPDKEGVTPISKMIGEGVAAATAGKDYNTATAFAAAVENLAKTNVKRLPKVGTDRAAWLFVQHADDRGYVIKGTDISAPQCMSRSVNNNTAAGEGAVLRGMARCYNIALYQGYNRLSDAPYPPTKYVPWSMVAVILGVALLAAFLVSRGGGSKRHEDADTSIIPTWVSQQ